MKKIGTELTAAFQFLTRLPVPALSYSPDLLGKATKFFPVVGLVIGAGGVLLHSTTAKMFPTSICALFTLTYLILVTGGLHEDALADASDGFGGGSTRQRVLEIMRDSRIGSYGGLALALSLLWRFVLLAKLPDNRFPSYFVAAQVLSRWTILPLSYVLPPARTDGSGVTVAQHTSKTALVIGTILALAVVVPWLKIAAWLPLSATSVVVLLTGRYYHRKLGGVTGDCFGATAQITEIAVYLCGCVLASS